MSLAAQAAALGLAVPQVLGHRLSRMALAGGSPSLRDRREFSRMATEKLAAFSQSWTAMAAEAFLAQQRIALSIMSAVWFPWAYSGHLTSAMNQLSGAALRVCEKGLGPIQRRATANARRLARRRS